MFSNMHSMASKMKTGQDNCSSSGHKVRSESLRVGFFIFAVLRQNSAWVCVSPSSLMSCFKAFASFMGAEKPILQSYVCTNCSLIVNMFMRGQTNMHAQSTQSSQASMPRTT